MDEYAFEAELWIWDANTKGSWFFVTVPAEESADLRFEAGELRGFGSVRVQARIGSSAWRTSVFPQSDTGCFVLPVKKAVRSAEGIDEGDTCAVVLRLADESS